MRWHGGRWGDRNWSACGGRSSLVGLLDCLLVPLLQSLHLFLLLVASVDRFPYWSTNWTAYILAPVVVTENIPRTHAVWNQALLIFAFRDMLPQTLHTRAVRRDRTSPVLVLTLRSVPQQQQPLLLMA